MRKITRTFQILTSTLALFSLFASSTSAAGLNGLFGDYFTRMTGLCIGVDQVITGFDTAPGTFGTKQCKSIKDILGGLFSGSLAPAGQAVVGFNSDGTLKYATVSVAGTTQWSGIAPGNIYYTGVNVGIGTATPGTKLDVVGKGRISDDFIVSGGPVEGGQLILGYKGISPTGQVDSTWNLDVDAANNLRVFNQKHVTSWNGGGYSIVQQSLQINEQGGYVGIGTTTPIRALSVGGGEISIYKQANNYGFLNVSDPSGNGGGNLWIRGLMSNGSAGTNLGTLYLSANYTTIVPGGRLCLNGLCKTDWPQTPIAINNTWTTIYNNTYNGGPGNKIAWGPGFTLQNDVLAVRMSGASDDGGVCQAMFGGYFSAAITNRAYITTLPKNSQFYGSAWNNGAGAMSTAEFGPSNFGYGGASLGAQNYGNNVAYAGSRGLTYLPKGIWVSVLQWYNDGQGAYYNTCKIEVIYADTHI